MNEFMEKYNAVFHEDGRQKYCGRDACIELIKECKKLGVGDFGDECTGFMNKEAIIDLKLQLLGG